MKNSDVDIYWTDVHTHINMLKSSVEDVIQACREQKVRRCITISTEPDDFALVFSLAQKFAPFLACTLGVHPHEADKWNAAAQMWIESHAEDPNVVAIAEIGLDYYYKNRVTTDEQISVFREQMIMAEKLNLPVEIHTREAEDDTIKVLEEFSGRVTGLLHCFTSSAKLAEAALSCGFDISISGVVTFKNAEALRQIVTNIIPLDRLHIETDAPFLAPVPMRGKDNTPAFLPYTAQFVAQLKQVTLSELSQQLENNVRRMFPKWEQQIKKPKSVIVQ